MKQVGKLWGKGGDNIAKIIDKTVSGEELSNHQKDTLNDFHGKDKPPASEHHIPQQPSNAQTHEEAAAAGDTTHHNE